eukprot:TRINITY_DN2134_c0_g2_i1.p1 TRINITY_DN2134_c0_g2~~TRINITY_DN2134_c0_g2_i1.p1  ORF type:complete len:214 (+),score=26.22 TRINITY_DN2134_c0_g2_i1:112-753(+)
MIQEKIGRKRLYMWRDMLIKLRKNNNYVETCLTFLKYNHIRICILKGHFILEVIYEHYERNKKRIKNASVMFAHANHSLRAAGKLIQNYIKDALGNEKADFLLSQLKKQGCKIFYFDDDIHISPFGKGMQDPEIKVNSISLWLHLKPFISNLDTIPRLNHDVIQSPSKVKEESPSEVKEESPPNIEIKPIEWDYPINFNFNFFYGKPKEMDLN